MIFPLVREWTVPGDKSIWQNRLRKVESNERDDLGLQCQPGPHSRIDDDGFQLTVTSTRALLPIPFILSAEWYERDTELVVRVIIDSFALRFLWLALATGALGFGLVLVLVLAPTNPILGYGLAAFVFTGDVAVISYLATNTRHGILSSLDDLLASPEE